MSSIIDGLKKYRTTELADALLKLEVPHGGYLSGLKMWSPQYMAGPTQIVGKAYTVKFVQVNHRQAPKLETSYADTIPEGAVVFLSAPPNQVNVCTGGLLSQRCQYRGAVGTVADGQVRDLQDHRDLNYPLFARGIGTTGGREVCKPSELNVPVRLHTDLQEAWIYPGDYLVADIDGVICVPQDLAEETLKVAPIFSQADKMTAADIAKGVSFTETSKKYRTNMYNTY